MRPRIRSGDTGEHPTRTRRRRGPLARLPSAAAAQFVATTADGSAAIVKTEFALVPEDVNGRVDAYARVGGLPKLLTHGTGTDTDTYLQRASGDGLIAFFRTSD